MEKVLKNISKIIFALSILALPFMGIGGVYGLVGSTALYYFFIWLGYIGLIVLSFISMSRYKFFPIIIAPVVLIVVGITLDTNFWTQQNANLCEELRKNPTCAEDKCGFTCSNFEGVGFVTGGTVCKDKNPSLCR